MGIDLVSFKKAYDKAIEDNKSTFKYKNQVILVSYAKYVIEYIENKT